MKKLFVVLHHTDDPTQGAQFDKVNAYHRSRGFPRSTLGYYVGYHFFIGYDGTIKQARMEDERGAHCDAKMMNVVGLGICLAGDFTMHDPNPAQIDALEQLLTEVQSKLQIPDEAILLHRECKPTGCPGIDLRSLAMARRKRREVQEGLASSDTPASMKRSLARALARLIRRGVE